MIFVLNVLCADHAMDSAAVNVSRVHSRRPPKSEID